MQIPFGVSAFFLLSEYEIRKARFVVRQISVFRWTTEKCGCVSAVLSAERISYGSPKKQIPFWVSAFFFYFEYEIRKARLAKDNSKCPVDF